MITHKKSVQVFCVLAAIWWIIGFFAINIYSQEELFGFFNAFNTSAGDKIMPYITKMGEGWFIVPAILLLLILFRRFRTKRIIILSVLALGIPPIITQILKFSVDVDRPLKVFENQSWVHIVPGYENSFYYSWPSGHTTGAFSLFFLLTYLLNDKYRWLAILFLLTGLLVGFSRMYLSQHFFEDVLAGSIIGTVVPFLLIYFIEKRMRVTSIAQ